MVARDLGRVHGGPAVHPAPRYPIFHTRGGQPGPKGGRPRPPAPYTKDMLSRDFAKVRELAFGEEEDRKISDMRRSGAVEGDAGAVPCPIRRTRWPIPSQPTIAYGRFTTR